MNGGFTKYNCQIETREKHKQSPLIGRFTQHPKMVEPDK